MSPGYPDSSYLDMTYNHHSSKSKSATFNVAHDVRCIFSKATVEIVERFKHVATYDSNESSLLALRKGSVANGSDMTIS